MPRNQASTSARNEVTGLLARAQDLHEALIIFDRRANVPPIYERLKASKATTPIGKEIVLIRA